VDTTLAPESQDQAEATVAGDEEAGGNWFTHLLDLLTGKDEEALTTCWMIRTSSGPLLVPLTHLHTSANSLC
jgi:hypothetical protein